MSQPSKTKRLAMPVDNFEDDSPLDKLMPRRQPATEERSPEPKPQPPAAKTSPKPTPIEAPDDELIEVTPPDALKQTTAYLRAAQLDKLDDLALAYKKATGRRVNRQHIIRWLVAAGDLDAVKRGAKSDPE